MTPRGRRVLAASLAVGVLAAGVGALVAVTGDPVVVRETCTASAGGESHDLAPDQAANAATITAIAVQRGLPARAATIALATAVQESKLRNIDYGDRDSVGLFQQRPSQGWGTVEQIMDPVYSTNAFYDGLVRVDGYESMEITVAAQTVQRSGFPEAYADHEPEGRVFASALTGYSPAALTCRLRMPSATTGPDAEDAASRAAAVAEALGTELGGVSVVSADGPRLTLDAGDGDDATRRGWAAAHWAVASAAAYDVVAVAVDGRRWDRSAPGDGWGASDEAPTEPGEVVVTVAG
ncbi:hypothetical protein [Thalassiella azotivora]